ncbi:MAG TPA: MoxR family ATPase [Firmicutes bacterium]|nr:MoxR family ATPase [Bacillota bacterium]
MLDNLSAITEAINTQSRFVSQIKEEMEKVLVGQEKLINGLLIGLLANGHILLEGVPGLAKTLAVKILASTIKADFQRIQFTPDLLPADLLGTLIYNPQTGDFITKKGPIFAQIILADEINRAPAKVQSALLEAMEEKQVTIGENTFPLGEPFMVLATQNPLEQQGTYPLPEAQLDRFILKLKLGYPSKEEEIKIMEKMARTEKKMEVTPVISPQDILRARGVVDQIYMDPKIKEYIVNIVMATRKPEDYALNLSPYIEYGASPRATISFALAVKAYAFIQGRGYVVPNDIKVIAHDILRHRIIITYEAEAEELTVEDLIDRILNGVEVP